MAEDVPVAEEVGLLEEVGLAEDVGLLEEVGLAEEVDLVEEVLVEADVGLVDEVLVACAEEEVVVDVPKEELLEEGLRSGWLFSVLSKLSVSTDAALDVSVNESVTILLSFLELLWVGLLTEEV
ncbi:MAG: hypothetical protein IJ370_00660 [Oscillospiraceae bacterium]|nr:hypothetical protein [Oscillospiraceae bacterium]